MSEDWPQVEPIRAAIDDLERELAVLYARRGDVIEAMVRARLTRREIGRRWKVSNVAITKLIAKRGGTAYIMSKGATS